MQHNQNSPLPDLNGSERPSSTGLRLKERLEATQTHTGDASNSSEGWHTPRTGALPNINTKLVSSLDTIVQKVLLLDAM